MNNKTTTDDDEADDALLEQRWVSISGVKTDRNKRIGTGHLGTIAAYPPLGERHEHREKPSGGAD